SISSVLKTSTMKSPPLVVCVAGSLFGGCVSAAICSGPGSAALSLRCGGAGIAFAAGGAAGAGAAAGAAPFWGVGGRAAGGIAWAFHGFLRAIASEPKRRGAHLIC